MGVGSEVYCAVRQGRKGIGVELKASYYRQSVANVKEALSERPKDEELLFDEAADEPAVENEVNTDTENETLEPITDTEEM